MKYRTLSAVKDGLSLVMNYAVNLSLLIAMAGALETEVAPWKITVVLLIQVFLYFVRRFINNIAVFTIIHLGTLLVFSKLLVGDVKETVLLILFLLAYTVYSFVIRLKRSEPGENEYNPAGAAVMLVLSMIILSYVSCERYLKVIPYLTLCYITLYYPVMYIKKFTWFDFMSRKTITHMPTGNLVKATAPYVAGMSIFYAITALICLNESFINNVATAVKNAIRRFLMWILSFVPQGEEETEMVSPDSRGSMEMFPFDELTEDTEPSKLLQILEQLLIYVTVAAVIAFLIFLIYKLITYIIGTFHGVDKAPATVLTKDYVEEREELKATKGKKKEKRSLFATPSDKIRNLYIKIVEKNKKDSLNPNFVTAREFMEMFENDKRDAALGFVKLYEKARYSALECNKADVKTAREKAELLLK